MKKNKINEEKPKKKKKGLIILIILILIIVGIIVFIVPRIQEEGISGIFDFVKLDKEDTKYYELYEDALSKYKDGCGDGYRCFFTLHYLDKVDSPVVIIDYDSDEDGIESTKTSIAYIKNGKVIIKDYNAISYVEVMYNTEKDEINYYLYEKDNNKHITSYTLLKDIVTESTSPYTFTFTSKDTFHTTEKDSNKKVAIPMENALFVNRLDNYQDNKKHDQKFSFVDGYSAFKRYLKRAIASKYYLKDLLTESAREKALEKISYYNIKPGQNVTGSNNTTNKTTKKTTNKPKITKQTAKKTTTKSTSKCNNGFVYVSDDNRCYNSKDKKNQINRCGSNDIDLGVSCGTAVDNSLCTSNPEQYEVINGYCIDKSTEYSKSIECPSGYEILFGDYSGQTFNGDCYKYMKPNY